MARQYYCSCSHKWCDAVYDMTRPGERNLSQLFGLSLNVVQRASMLRLLRPNENEPAPASRPRFAYHHLRPESFTYDQTRNKMVVRTAIVSSTLQQPPPAQGNFKWDGHAWVDPAAPATTSALAALRTTVREPETGASRGTFTSSSARFTEEHLARHDSQVDRVALETLRDLDESDPSAKRRRSAPPPPPPSEREVYLAVIATIQHNEANAAQAEGALAAKRREIQLSHITAKADEAHRRAATTLRKLKRMSSHRDEVRKTVELQGARVEQLEGVLHNMAADVAGTDFAGTGDVLQRVRDMDSAA
jgi:hypothetical protein